MLFRSDLDDYQRWLLEQSRDATRVQAKGDKARRKREAAVPAPTAATASAAAGAASGRGNDRKAAASVRQQRSDGLKPLRKELVGIDQRLGVLTGDRSACEASMTAPGLTPAQRAGHGKRLKQIGDEIDTLEARWLELSTRLDAASSQPTG